jgi:hypothetical protein
MNFISSQPCVSRDPVAETIEKHLRNLGAVFQCELRVDDTPPEFHVSFGGTAVAGESFDIAFVRLAFRLLDDERFSDSIKATLHELRAA